MGLTADDVQSLRSIEGASQSSQSVLGYRCPANRVHDIDYIDIIRVDLGDGGSNRMEDNVGITLLFWDSIRRTVDEMEDATLPRKSTHARLLGG
jgi:hypothetical protein